ncbi:MAG: hypothetical protein JJ879_01475 [Sneathiella sp.]|nr:hypothetical protein [Sneathiella sp.]
MKQTFLGIMALVIFAATALTGHIAQATVSSATPVPVQVSVSPTGGAVNITWRVVHSVTAPGTVTTSSPDYTINVNGVPFATVTKSLSRTTTIPAGVPETLTFTETIPVSAALAIRIADNNNVATIVRLFSDGFGGPQTATARLNVAGSAGALSINRIDLAFENGSKTRIIEQNNELFAVADINFRAKGLLQAEWRLIDSNSIRGGQFERVLGVVRRQLSAAGNGRIRLKSPKLPTDLSGLHQVRLVITDPGLRFEEPTLRYYVSPSSLPGGGRLLNVEVVQPKDNAALNTDQAFTWLSVPGAAAYQIEIFNSGAPSNPAENLSQSPLIVGPLDVDGKLVAGKIVPGTATSATLQQTSFQHLEHGRTYLWRLRAISDNGTVIAQSDLRKIRYP